MSFSLKKTLKLDHYEGWKDCYISFSAPNIEQVEELSQSAKSSNISEQVTAVKRTLQSCFIKGVGFDGSKHTDITKENIATLPMDIYLEIINFLLPNASQVKHGSTNIK